MEDDFDDDEPFIYRLNDNGSGPSLLIKVGLNSYLKPNQNCHEKVKSF